MSELMSPLRISSFSPLSLASAIFLGFFLETKGSVLALSREILFAAFTGAGFALRTILIPPLESDFFFGASSSDAFLIWAVGSSFGATTEIPLAFSSLF
jgi:hypothetical protein